MSRANPRFRRVNPTLPSLSSETAMRITPMGLIDNQMWLTNFDYIWIGGTIPNANAESNLSTAWIVAVATAFKAFLANDVIWNAVKVTCLTSPTRQPSLNTAAAQLGNGTGGASHIPSEMAAIVSKYTNFKGQHGRGRNYLPGVPTAFVTPGTDANRLNAAGATALNNFTNTLAVTISDGTNNYSLAITQRTRGGLAATNGALVPSTGIQGKLLLGTVRRRRIGRGK